MDSLSRNYDPQATKSGRCWPNTYGCLHPAARNYGCAKKWHDEDVGPDSGDVLTTCVDSNGWPNNATTHASWRCNYYNLLYVGPVYEAVLELFVAETVSEMTPPKQAAACDV